MNIHLYNTATKNKDTFKPLTPGKVTLYTCGPTVYDTPHIGNWISFLRWDVLVRTLHLSGLSVERVMNITDVGHLVSETDEGEDKMQKGARREGVTAWEVAKRYTDEFLQGMHDLNMMMPEHITKATEHIDSQLALVRALKDKGYTYQIDDGIYFDTSKFSQYAAFARINLDDLKAGARVGVNQQKRNLSDFALWKFSPTGTHRDMEWETPKDILEVSSSELKIEEPQIPNSKIQVPTMGFPGWHLECSAMAMQYLGETIDIHTGGIDHIPVHHTNEIAQSEAATGKTFAHYWVHNAHMLSDGTKISKSLNNGYSLADMAKEGYSAMDFRMFVLQSHYRTESNFTWPNVAAAKARLARWRAAASLRWQVNNMDSVDKYRVDALTHARRDALSALQDDLDTPKVLTIIDNVFRIIDGSSLTGQENDALSALLTFIDDGLGLDVARQTPDIETEAKHIIDQRQQARAAKQWSRSDELRDILHRKNIGLNDTAEGAVWYWL